MHTDRHGSGGKKPVYIRVSPWPVRVAMTMLFGCLAVAQSGVSFPIVGLGSGQAARLNVLNLAAVNPANPSNCPAELQFLDTSPKQVKQSSVQIPAGQSASLELLRSDLTGEKGRVEIRAVVLFGSSGGAAPPTGRPTDCSGLVPSLEIYDRDTGKTRILVTTTKDLPTPGIIPQ